MKRFINLKKPRPLFYHLIIGSAGLLLALGQPGHGFVIGEKEALVKDAKPSTAKASPEVSNVTKRRVIQSFLRMPLTFEANHGQVDKQVKYLAKGSGYTLFLTPKEAVLVLRK